MRRGQRQPPPPRDTYPTEGIRIADAYADLPREAFAVWIRLSVMAPKNFSLGYRKLCSRFGYERHRFAEVIQKLQFKGYVRIERDESPFGRCTIHIVRRPMLVGADFFLKLS